LKTVSDDLYRLIKNLTRSEKGYFKKFAAKNAAGSKQNYLVLFDAIDNMDSYDEDILRKKLKNEPLIKQLAVYKVYLFNLILKSLQQYGAVDNSTTRVKDMIDNAKMLESKAMYREALRLLKKAKEICYKYKKHSQLLEILIAERNIMVVLPDKNILENRKKVYEEELQLANEIKKYFEYSWLADQILIFVEQKGDFTAESREKEITRILSHPYLADEANADDYIFKNYYYHSYLFYHLSKNNLQGMHEILGKELELQENYRHFIEDNPKNYITTIVNYLLSANLLKKRDDVNKGIIKLNAARKKFRDKVSLSLQLHILIHTLNAEMMVYRNNADLKRGRLTVKKIEAAINEHKHDFPAQVKVSLLSNAACFCFIDEKYDQALSLTNMVMNETSINFKSDVNFFVRLLQILIHIELENYDLLEYLVDSTYKYFKEKNEIFKAESALFDFFRKAIKLRKDELPEAFKELGYKFKKLSDAHTQNILALFDFNIWIESKIQNKRLSEVIKEKAS